MNYYPDDYEGPEWTDEEIAAYVEKMEEEERRQQEENEWIDECQAEQMAYWEEHPEEFDAFVDDMLEVYYSELWQYVDVTHTDKANGRINANATSVISGKKNPDYSKFKDGELPYVRLHSFYFDELIAAHKNGATFKRVPRIYDGGKHSATRYVILDLDNEPYEKNGPTPDITADELNAIAKVLNGEQSDEPAANKNDFLTVSNPPPMPKPYVEKTFVVLPSTSGNPYKHHIFIKHPTPIYTPDEYKAVYIEYSKMIEKAVGRKLKTDYRVCDWCHWFYGNPQDTEHELIINKSDIVTLQLTEKRQNVELRPTPKDKAIAAQYRPSLAYTLVPDSMSKLMREFGVSAMNAPGFRSHLPWITKDSSLTVKKIAEGERYTTLMNYMLALYDFWRLYNYWAAIRGRELLPPESLLYTFQYRSNKAYEQGGSDFSDDLANIKQALRMRIDANSHITDKDWLNGQYKAGKTAKRANGDVQRVWRIRGYCESAARYIAEQHGCIDGNTVATFKSRAELNGIVDANLIKYPTFRTYMKKFGYSIKCVERKKDKEHQKHKLHSNTKFGHIIDGAILVDGVNTFYYNKFVKNESQFAKRHGIAYVKRVGE